MKERKTKKETTKLWKKSWWHNPKMIRAVIIVVLSIIFSLSPSSGVPGNIYYRIKETFAFTAEEDTSVTPDALIAFFGAKPGGL